MTPERRSDGATQRRGAHLAAVVVLLLLALAPVHAEETEEAELLTTGSRSPYVHQLTLYDHDGTAISPDDTPAMAYSPQRTCGKCHPYGQISDGWHFSFNDPNAVAGRPGEPWLVVDPNGGAVRAISGRGWPGTQTPAQAGLSNWEYVKRFGHHIPGGGYGEPTRAVIDASDKWLRWSVSGPLEIDCMFCHSADQRHDPAAPAAQIEKENFRWSATAALGLAAVRGEASKAPDDWDPWMPPNPDRPEESGPTLIYDATRFDPDDRVFFNITRRVPNQRCYFCHTVRPVGEGAPEDWQRDTDVHLAAGLLCVDCHRHGLGHHMTRGYEGEANPTTQPAKASLTCRGCHLGEGDAATIAAALGGRLAAPHPQHRGFPPLHFEKLTCTACHAGPWPQPTTERVQTSLAHQLGLASRERHADTPPTIVQPVFVRNERDAIEPRRAVAVGTAGAPYTWPLAHDVRPAAQSLGVRGCDDCHASDAPLFFGTVALPDEVRSMTAFHGYDATLAKVWGLGFVGRPIFKWFGIACAVLIAALLLRFACEVWQQRVLGVELPPRSNVAPAPPPRLTSAYALPHAAVAIGALLQASTGFGTELVGAEFAGWPLLVHMGGAGLFIAGLTVTALQWARWCRPAATQPSTPTALTAGQRWMFWLVLLLGLGMMGTMLSAMLPVFGYAAQDALIEIHETIGLVLLAALVVHTIVSLRARRARGTTT